MRVFPLLAFAEVGIITLQRHYLPHPVACFSCVYEYGQIFVVGTQHELGEESNLRSVFAFGFHLVGESGAQVFQPFAVFPAVEQNFVHDD